MKVLLKTNNKLETQTKLFKGALDKCNITSDIFQKSWDFYTIRGVGMGNYCMLSFTF